MDENNNELPPASAAHFVQQPTENKITKKLSTKKKLASTQAIEEFRARLREHGDEMFDQEKHAVMIKQLYYIEEDWTEIIHDTYLTARMKEQQSCIWELLKTERNYICKMRLVWEVFIHFFRFAKNEELSNIKPGDIFANIDEVFRANDTIWQDYFVQVLNKARSKRRIIKATELLSAFHKTEELFHPYYEFFMKIDGCLKRIRDFSDVTKDAHDRTFKTYLNYCEELPQCNRLKLVSLMTEPVQRMTRYPLLLNAIQKATEDSNEKEEIQTLIHKIERFITRINTRLRKIEEKKELLKILDEFEEYNTWSAGNEDVMWGCVEFLKSDISNLKEKEQRCFLKRDFVKLIDKRNRVEMSIEILLFTDVIVFARRRSNSKKLTVVKQLHYLDRVQFIKSEISPTSIVVIYLDENGMLASSLMIDMNEKSRDLWIEAVEKAQDRYEKAKEGTGSTLDFFQDSKGVSDDNINSSKPPRKTSDLINSVEITRRMSSGSNKNVEVPVKSRSPSTASQQKEVTSYENKAQDLESKAPKVELPVEETGLNRRSASWLLTDEKRVRSIRDLLREDLWATKRPNIRSSDSFRSDVSDSDLSCSESILCDGLNGETSEVSSVSSVESRGSADSKRDNNNQSGKNGARKRTSNLNGKTEQRALEFPGTRALPRRKISSSDYQLLPEISENVRTEITFLPKHQIKEKNQRLSLKADNNNNRTPSPRRSNSEGSRPERTFEEVFTDGSSNSSQNGDTFDDYLRDQ